MNDPKIDKILENIKNRMLLLKQRKFFGSSKIEMEYKDGGISSVHIGDREKIL